MQNSSPLNNSLIVRRTRSRSNSISSFNSASHENMSVDTPQSFSIPAPAISLPRTSSDIEMTAALSKSFFASGASNTWDNIKGDIKKLSTRMSRFEGRLEAIESKLELLDRMELKLDLVLNKLQESSQTEGSTITQSESILFQPGNALYTQLSGWIHASLSNQQATNLEWDYSKPLKDTGNNTVTHNVINFVGSQIEEITNKPWVSSVSYVELKKKISLVFYRQKATANESEEKTAIKKKRNIRKTRRVTKVKHRKSIVAHPFFGPQMISLYGGNISELLLEQLQSDEESTDTEAGETEKSSKLKVIVPSWRSEKCIEAFKKFNEFDIQLRKNARKEKELRVEGRVKNVEVKAQFLDQAPSWSKKN